MALASTTPVLAVALVARIVIKEIRHKTIDITHVFLIQKPPILKKLENMKDLRHRDHPQYADADLVM
jgi:hypothetical protein